MSFFSFLIQKKFPNHEVRKTLFQGPLTLLRLMFYVLCAGLLILVYILLVKANSTLLVTVPSRGGRLTEGIIGAPRFINPVLASTETDEALSSLIFAGLMKELGDGTLTPELARSYVISPDNRTYTFTLRDKLTFHDGSALTSSDVAFTIEKLQDPLLNPRTASFWQGVSVSTPDEKTVIATLVAPDASFLQDMTIGVLPAAIWQGVADEAFTDPSLNLSPVGAGAFKVAAVESDDMGTPKKILLSRNRKYALGSPLLSSLSIVVFSNQDTLLSAMKNGAIDLTFNLLPETLRDGVVPKSITLTPIETAGIVALFRRDGSAALSNTPLLATLNRFVDKSTIVATVENGYGIPASDVVHIATLEEAQDTLTTLGYTIKDGVLTKDGMGVALGIATLNSSKLVATARALAGQLTALGVMATVLAFDPGTFQNDLDAGTFPLVLSDSASSLPPSYTSVIPLYTPAIVLAADGAAHGIPTNTLQRPTLRYADAMNWHEKTDRVYRWFTKRKQ